jgi:hypothetical protein
MEAQVEENAKCTKQPEEMLAHSFRCGAGAGYETIFI